MLRRLSASLLSALAVTSLCASASAAAPAYSLTDRLKGPDGGFDFVTFDPAMRRVYVSRSDGVTAVDVATGKVTGHLAAAQHSHEALPVLGGTKLVVTDGGTNSALLVDAVSGAQAAAIPVGQKPDAAILDPATGLALVMDGATSDISLIDPAKQKVVSTIPIGGDLESPALDGAGHLFLTIENENRIAVIDLKAGKRTGYYALNGCEGPGGLVYAPDAGVLIAACQNKVAKVLRASDGQEVATLPIGAGPDQAAYDPKRHMAFIPCGKDGVLEVIAVRGPTDVAVVQTVQTQKGSRTATVDPETGKVYLPGVQYGPAPAGGGRPPVVPGSFEILVVSPGA